MEPVKTIRPHAGPQEKFLATSADIAIYGGAAGGGKSFALLMEPLRHIKNPRFGAVIFRRTFPQIFNEGSLWDTAMSLYPMAGGVPRVGNADWEFPSGAKVSFHHMEHENSKSQWDGSQVPLIEFDELTHFSASQFWYMLSRNRTTIGIRPYIRASCNPDSESWVAELIAWWIDQDTGLAIPERSGVVRWFVRLDGTIHWGDSRQELLERFKAIPDIEPKSLTFVPAELDDNPTLTKNDPGYRANLLAMERVERERLLKGNWKVRPAAGLKFPRDKWRKYAAAPPGMRLLRFWDKAATEGGKGARTAGVLVGELEGHAALGMPRWWIVHAEVGRWADAEREAKIWSRGVLDNQLYGHVTVGLEREPGSGGKHSTYVTITNMAGLDVYGEAPTTNKAARWTGLATQQQIGNVAIVESSDWDHAEFIRELDALAGDDKLDKGKLKDLADAASGAFKGLIGNRNSVVGDLLTSGDEDDEHGPMSEKEIAELPDYLRDIVTGVMGDDDRGFGRRRDDL